MVVIVGAGAAGLALARSLRRRGLEPLVLDRGAAGAWMPRPFMPPYQGFDALADAGCSTASGPSVGDRAARRRRARGPGRALRRVMALLADGVPVRHGVEVTGLLVTGTARRGAPGNEEVPADLVVACDGIRSPVRPWPASRRGSSCSRAPAVSFIGDLVCACSTASPSAPCHYRGRRRRPRVAAGDDR